MLVGTLVIPGGKKKYSILNRYSSFASGDFNGLLTTFENSLDPDQGPDLDPNCLTL